jgi:hypothetical protein
MALSEEAERESPSSYDPRRKCCRTSFSIYHVRHNYKTLLFGQLLSAEFVLASTGAAQATLHLNCDLSAPTFTIGIIYFAFCRFII